MLLLPVLFVALASTVNIVQALGSAIINNQCDFDTYLWPVDAERNSSNSITVKSNSIWSECFHVPSSGGVSLKISRTTNETGPITQFEYTVQPYSGIDFVWYDGSNVDCTEPNCPFQEYGLNLTTSMGNACPRRYCRANATTCPGFYIHPKDDANTLSCDDSVDITLILCSG